MRFVSLSDSIFFSLIRPWSRTTDNKVTPLAGKRVISSLSPSISPKEPDGRNCPGDACPGGKRVFQRLDDTHKSVNKTEKKKENCTFVGEKWFIVNYVSVHRDGKGIFVCTLPLLC